MASHDFDATAAPADVVGALSLTVGVVYSLQNISYGCDVVPPRGRHSCRR